jgi:NadR type nicotinamide-nucleotide adenylyltransferase
MTAMPPTVGHLALIQYARSLTTQVIVIVNTQPDEPMADERYWSIVEATRHMHNISVQRIHQTLPQEPEGQEGFWDMWGDFLRRFGFWDGDYIVASELYGVRLAQEVNGIFMPYDIERSIRYTKGTLVREDYRAYWYDILPEFRKYLQKRVTIFGAESCGKTTTSRTLAKVMPNTNWYFEWARPYLEAVGAEVTVEKMVRIYSGQEALQRVAREDVSSEFTIFDTDLFSTIGYWEMYSPDSVPPSIYINARELKSDLYIILASNIPFEEDQLRYGGTERESTDQYWIDLCERENLPYEYITNTASRVNAVEEVLFNTWPGTELEYQRLGKEYEKDV